MNLFQAVAHGDRRWWLLGGMTALFVARPLFPSESAANYGDGLPMVMLWIALAMFLFLVLWGRLIPYQAPATLIVGPAKKYIPAQADLPQAQQLFSPAPFDVRMGIEYLFMAVVGGAGSVWGAVLGATVITLLKQVLQDVLPWMFGRSGNFELIVFGILVGRARGLYGVHAPATTGHP